MEYKEIELYKLANPNGWDFYTGETINYRDNIGKVVSPPKPNRTLGMCSSGVIHASSKPNDCFAGTEISCSAYLVRGTPVCGVEEKYGFVKLAILEEICDLDSLFGWRYFEAINPIDPLRSPKRKPMRGDIKLLEKWASVRASGMPSVWDSVRASVWDSIRASVWDLVMPSIWASVRASVWDSVKVSVGDSVWDSIKVSVWDSVGAYIGYIFVPSVKKWLYIKPAKKEAYPFQAAVDLWKRGFIASFDGKIWRLHSGEKTEIVYEMHSKIKEEL